MKDQLSKFTSSLNGISLVRSQPSVTDGGVMNLTLEVTGAIPDPCAVVRAGLADAGLVFASLHLFRAVPRSAVIARGVAPQPVQKKTETKGA